jgi:hypothetical protein
MAEGRAGRGGGAHRIRAGVRTPQEFLLPFIEE